MRFMGRPPAASQPQNQYLIMTKDQLKDLQTRLTALRGYL